MKLDKVLCCMFLFFFFSAFTVHKPQWLFTTDRGDSIQQMFWLRKSREEQKIVRGRVPSSINLSIFVYSFDACRSAS